MASTLDIRKVEKVFAHFATIDPKMQLSTAMVFIEVVKGDLSGDYVTNRQIETKLGMKSGTTTRNIYYWTEDGHQDNTGKAGFVDVRVSIQDRRMRELRLTAKGKAFINSLLED